jgi:acyl carrier protein
LSEAGTTRASLESVPEWDSLAAVTLVAVVEEEFGVAIDADDLPKLTSFDLVLNYLEAQGRTA